MRSFWRFMSNWWTVSILTTIILIVLLSIGLPLLVAAMQPLWVRLTTGGSVFVIWLIMVIWRVRKARIASRAIEQELIGPSAEDEESERLSQRMKEALTTLKTDAGKKPDYLYSKPWFVIIGPPGGGKTTALLNSGLRFPSSRQANRGVGGTRDLDFWFADEAALVDTAGRYTTQDSDASVDQRGWTSFLSLLKKHRPLQPINGIIIAISVEELIQSDCAMIDAHSATVRRRLAEIRRTLEVAAPVYVLLTKSDLLAGFTEYYDDLDVEGRRSVLGSTLPFDDFTGGIDQVTRAFDEMNQAIADRQAKRLLEETDQRRRSLILGFPSQVSGLRSRLIRFLDGAIISAPADQTGVLRGFYFTSGLQEGAPLDRILAGVSSAYQTNDPYSAGGGSGRAYFLNRLLTDVMFKEAGLVAMDPAARRKQKLRLTAAYSGIGAAVLLTLLAWGISFSRNWSYQSDVAERVAKIEVMKRDLSIDMKQVREDDADLRDALPLLNALRNMPHGYAAQRSDGTPYLMRFGLFQGGLAAQSELSYREALRRIMLPRLMLRLEKYMAATEDPLTLYDPLKVYLMLGSKGPMDKKKVEAWIASDWAEVVYPGADSNADRAALSAHLATLLEDENIASSWKNRSAPIDVALVARARAAVQTMSLAERAYAVMRQNATTAGTPWRISNVLSQGDALAFANPKDLMTVEVPYFFTRAGFEKNYTVALATVQSDLQKDRWVFDEPSNNSSITSEMSNIRSYVPGFYAKDYIAAWKNVIDKMQPAAYFSDTTAFGAFTKSPSPLKRVLIEVRKNTTFTGGLNSALATAAKNRINRNSNARYLDEFNNNRATGLNAGDEISLYFKQINEYVGDGKNKAPIDDLIAAMKDAGQSVIAAKSVGGGGGSEVTQAQMAVAMASVTALSVAAPDLLGQFVTQARSGGSTARIGAAQGAISDAYAQSVLPACKEVAEERYPFFKTAATDAGLADVQRVFGLGGVIDSFSEQRLLTLVDRSGPVWRWNSQDPLTAALDVASPEEFAKAKKIRDMLAAGIPLKISLLSMGSEVGEVEISSGGTTYRFTQFSDVPRPLIWSGAGGLPEAHVTLFKEPTGNPAAEALPAATAPAAKGVAVKPAKRAPADEADKLRSFEAEGPWALFRLFEKAQMENAGEQTIILKFGEGARSAEFKVQLPTTQNPFSRGGFWSFRCPAAL
jgi:type VI secretion system protein ImpL